MSTLSPTPGISYALTQEDQDFFERLGVPLPSASPASIMKNLMAFRNERKLHRRQCDYSGKAILSAYPSVTQFPVYKNDMWWGDDWDPLEFGRNYDFSKPFFQQYSELQKLVPREGTSIFNSENCDYNSHTRVSRNCYMSSLIHRCEDVHYSYWMADDKDCLIVF